MAGDSKTEKATPKRKRDERKKGNVFSSKDLVSAFFILFIFFTLKITAKLMYTTLSSSMVYWINMSGEQKVLNEEFIKVLMVEVIKTFAIVVGPLLLVSIFSNILFTGVQTKFLFSMESIKFKLSHLNPLSGIKKLFSLRSAIEVVKSLLKLAIISAIIYDFISKKITEIAKLFDVEIITGVLYLASAIFSVVMTIAVVFIFLGIFDLAYQWWEYERNLKMSKQEIKEEYKQMEGDPQIKGKIRQKQREMANARMMQEVPNADVVIRNPTHYAIAIKYDPEKDRAPIVIAKGADNIALKIIEIAEEHKVIIQENRPLARALYAEVDLNREIPADFYHEVAEVLAFVYDLKNKKLY